MQHKSQGIQVLGESTHDVAAANQPVVSALRSDEGGEFTGVMFKEVCKRNEIKQEFTTRLSPRQDGTTLMSITRFIMDDGSSPPRGTVLQTAVYLSNRLPTRANGGETPLELPWEITFCVTPGRWFARPTVTEKNRIQTGAGNYARPRRRTTPWATATIHLRLRVPMGGARVKVSRKFTSPEQKSPNTEAGATRETPKKQGSQKTLEEQTSCNTLAMKNAQESKKPPAGIFRRLRSHVPVGPAA